MSESTITVVEPEPWEKHIPVIQDAWNNYIEKHSPKFGSLPPDFQIDKFDGWTTDKSEYLHLRMDWSLADDDEVKTIEDAVVGLMLGQQVAIDLADLAENGDTDNTAHPLYRVMDGSQKRGGAELKGLEIGEIHGFKFYVSRKESTVYHVYIAVKYIWD